MISILKDKRNRNDNIVEIIRFITSVYISAKIISTSIMKYNKKCVFCARGVKTKTQYI